MIKSTFLEKFEALPDSLQTEVIHYIEFLFEKYVKNSPPSQPEAIEARTDKPHGYGSWKGQIVMSDDFDESLEELEEYM